jgi:signal transduction histidine kinase
MAQDPLTRAVAAASIAALGVAAEIAAPQSPAFTAADFAVGAGLSVAGAWLLARTRLPAALALAAAALWFAGTFAGASVDVLSSLGSILLLSYRGPLLHLLLAAGSSRLGSRPARLLASAGWIAGVLPLAVAGPVTAAVAALVAVSTGAAARRADASRSPMLWSTAVAAGLLGALWAVPSLADGGQSALLALNDVAVAGAAAVALTAALGLWTQGTARAVVVELGPHQRRGQPLTVRLARALADPALEARYALAGVGWVDELGRPAPAPCSDGRQVTLVAAPQGGEVALVHGAGSSPDPRLARAAAAAAALALDAARLEAESRARALEIQASRLRLLGVADAERRELEQRLSDGVLVRLRRVARLLAAEGDPLAAEHAELEEAVGELLALGRGLYPPALDRADLAGALADVAGRSPVPTTVEVKGEVDTLPEALRAAVWFLCSEALANVARHAQASRAAVVVTRTGGVLELEISDDGRGGATLARGLRGLADRVDALGGTLVVSSPAGGPTVLGVRLPVESPSAPRAGMAAVRSADPGA